MAISWPAGRIPVVRTATVSRPVAVPAGQGFQDAEVLGLRFSASGVAASSGMGCRGSAAIGHRRQGWPQAPRSPKRQ